MNDATGDFLVIYEDDADGPDEPFVLDMHRKAAPRGEVEIDHDIRLGVTNTSSRVGTTGFTITIVGALVALGFMIAFGLGYPDNWFGAGDVPKEGGFVTAVMATALVGFVLMFAGTVLTHYGRRIRATGSLENIRVVQA